MPRKDVFSAKLLLNIQAPCLLSDVWTRAHPGRRPSQGELIGVGKGDVSRGEGVMTLGSLGLHLLLECGQRIPLLPAPRHTNVTDMQARTNTRTRAQRELDSSHLADLFLHSVLLFFLAFLTCI